MRKGLNTYKRLVIGTMCLTRIAAGIATASFSFSWFSNTNNVTRPIEGHTAGAYFAGGSGKKDDPYIISSPTHLYNLAWLYYIGYFKGEEPYFTISQDIDMNGWALPPIGTSTHPFNGHLDAASHKISNLKVSNSYDDLKSRKPSNVTEDDWLQNDASKGYGPTPNILGMFGYVAKESDDKGTPSIENLYINSEKVNSTTSTALTGIVAGYVDGKLDKIYIDNSTVTVADNTKAVGTLGDETISNISAYTSVGYCTENYRTKYNKYETTLYEPCYVASTSKDSYIPGGGSGQDNDFGGSIDMLTLNRRVSYIKKSGKSGYNVTFGTTSSSGYNWLTNSTYTDLSSGSYLPINVDMESTKLNDVSGTDDTSNSYYTNNSSEPTLETNSGYITGGKARVRAQASNKDNQGIKYAVKRVSGTTTGSQSGNFDLFSDSSGKVISLDKLKSNVGFLTYSFDQSSVAAIYDDDDKDFVQSSDFVYKVASQDQTSKKYVSASSFAKYSSVKNNLLQMFYDSTNAYYNNSGSTTYAIYLPGFRFQNMEKDSTFTAKTKWLGEDKTVTFHNNGVQFELKKDGYITAVVSKYDSTGSFVFYNLYSVDMDNDATLTKINTIHKDSSGNITYNQSDSSTKVFDFSPVLSTSTGMCAYQLFYFEVPVKKGAYFLSTYGSNDASSAYPYLLYLDIGANAGDGGSSSNEVTRTKVFELLEQITQAFTYPTGVYVADFDNAVLDTKTLCITLGATYSGDAKIDRTKNDVDTTVTANTSNNTGLAYFDSSFEKVTENSTETTSSDVNEGENTITTKRMTYFDCSSTSLTMFRFSQTSTNGGEYSSVTAETQYQASATTGDDGTITLGDWEETSGQTVYNDDGTKTDETNGIPSDISNDGIDQPDDFSISTNVFNLKVNVNKEDTFTNEYLSSVKLNTNKKAEVTGYDFTIMNGDAKIVSSDYSVTKNSSYSLKINGDSI